MANANEEWAALELAPWRGFSIERDDLADRLRRLADEDLSLFLFHVEDGRVRFEAKRDVERPWPNAAYDRAMHHRAEQYRAFLDVALQACGVTGSGSFLIELEDVGGQRFPVPVFAFQKRRGANTMLLPDVDLLGYGFFIDDRFADEIPFGDKRDEAIFVGSTTGFPVLSVPVVRELRNPRLRAGVFFRDAERVTFELPTITQFETAEAHDMVVALGIRGRPREWREQTAYRYLLSLDGNGATCSRVALSLAGHGVLVKYNSPYLLYYFHGLEPWRDYVPIIEDKDVLALMEDSAAHRELHRDIAARSRRFAQDHLSRIGVMRYSASLMRQYLALFGTGAASRQDAFLVDGHAYVAGAAHWGEPGGWIGDPDSGRPIEAFTLQPGPEIDPADIACAAIGPAGVLAKPAEGHERCAAGGAPLHGAQIVLRGNAARRYDLAWEARFADGTIAAPADDGAALFGSAPLTGLRLALAPKG